MGAGEVDKELKMMTSFLQENEVLFILGNYIQLMDKEGMNKQKKLLVDAMLGVLEAKLQFVKAICSTTVH